MFLAQPASIQNYTGYIISGLFALGGVILGAILSFLQQRHNQKLKLEETKKADFRSCQKDLYTEMLQLLQTSVLIEAIDDYSDKILITKYGDVFLDMEKKFITQKSMYIRLYGNPGIIQVFIACADLISEYLSEILKINPDTAKAKTYRKAIQIARSDITKLIIEELGIDEMQSSFRPIKFPPQLNQKKNQ